MPAIAARKRASEALGRSAVVFLMGAGFALGAVLPMKAKAAPYGSAPVTIPAVIEAEKFDRGGQGVGYRDLSPGNAGGKFRLNDDVDITAADNRLVINNFQTGEWLAYTINVPSTDDYDITLRVSTTFENSAFHVKVDGHDVTGPVSIPRTGGWNDFESVRKRGIRLKAGKRVLKVFADQQYFNLNHIKIERSASASASQDSHSRPYTGTPFAVPGRIPAEHFDRGGQGVAYRDKTTGNTGAQFRTSEDVDIVRHASTYVVNNFQTGEWLHYTIKVEKTDQYDIGLHVSSGSSDAAFRVDLDGVNKTGTVAVPNTGGWDQFKWVTKKGVTLSRGTHTLRIVASREYFNLNAIRIRETGASSNPGASPSPTTQTGSRQFFCTFQSSPAECGFGVQAKSNVRASIVSGGRDGSTAVRLRTEPGDNNVFGSGSSERADLSLSQGNTDCSQGKEAWWAHSVMFPSDYVSPTDGFGVAMDFHHTGSSGQANFHLDTSRWDGLMRFRGYGGSQDANEYGAVIGSVVKNQWYDFVYHVRWSSGSDGFMKAWVNGQKKLDHRGPTLYSGQGCYLKLANYHSPFGQASEVIHDRVIRGSTWQAVSRTTLEGVQ